MSETNYDAITCLLIALGLFVWSLCLPVWQCASGGTQLNGVYVLITGYMGLLYFDPRWFCNFIFLYAIVCVFFKEPKPQPIYASMAAAIGSTALIGPYFCGTPGSLDKGTMIASGGIVWVIALWVAVAAIFISVKGTEN